MSANTDQIAYWNDVAGAKWVAGQKQLDRLMAPLTEALLERVAPRLGEHALDVGCGCGDLTLKLAHALGAGGRVTAVDISKPMLAHAASRAAALPSDAQRSIRWVEADAMLHGFAAEQELLASRFGVMFFDDRRQAFSNLRTALKPGGRFAFLAWRGRADVEWMQKPLDWIAPAVPMPESSDGEIGPFGLARSDETLELLKVCGFRDVAVTPVDRLLTIGRNVEEACGLLSDAGPASRQIRDAPPDAQRKAGDLLRAGLERQAAGGPVEMMGACWLYQGRA